MTNPQLFIAIIVPMLFNGALIALLNNNIDQRFNDFGQRFQSFETRLEEHGGR